MGELNHVRLREMVLEIDEAEDISLTEWELEFIARLVDDEVMHFTPKQADQIRRIHREKL